MNEFNWIHYPESRPAETGNYVVNCEIDNHITNHLGFYDIPTASWYTSSEMRARLLAVNAFKAERTIPYIRN